MTPDAFQAAVIAAITTGILAAVVTQGGALIAGLFARRHEDRHRFTDHKRERFALLLREADEHVRVLKRQHASVVDWLTIGGTRRSDTVPSLASTDPLAHLAAEISLLGRKRDVGAAATSLYEALVGLDRFAWDDKIQNAGAWLNEVDAPMDEALASYELARKRFVDAAKIDLGTA